MANPNIYLGSPDVFFEVEHRNVECGDDFCLLCRKRPREAVGPYKTKAESPICAACAIHPLRTPIYDAAVSVLLYLLFGAVCTLATIFAIKAIF